MIFYKDITVKKVNWNLKFPIPVNFSKRLYERHYRNVNEIIPTDLLSRFESVGLRPSSVRIFCWPRNYVGIWHIDGRYFAGKDQLSSLQHVSMNWLLDGSGKIQWNKSVLPKLKPMLGVYLGIESSLDEPYDEETFGDGVLVDTTVPHRVLTGPDGRTTLTLQWGALENDFEFPIMVEKLRSVNLVV